MLLHKLLIITFLLPFATNTSASVASTSSNTWSEGACIEDGERFEGATRRYFNRAGRLEWQNLGGDWLDYFFSEQGKVPFAKLKQSVSKNAFIADVTELTRLWQQGVLENHGFYIKHNPSSRTKFYSKETTLLHKRPLLEVITRSDKYTLTNTADTEINLSTFRCLGNNTELAGSQATLWRFDLADVEGAIQSAKLKITAVTGSSSAKPSSHDVFAVYIPKKIQPKVKGFSQAYADPKSLKYDPRVILYEDFSSGKNSGLHEILFTNQTVINEDKYENFETLFGDTLAIKVEKGKFLGASRKLDISKNKLKQAYFRYHLRLGNSWSVNSRGKLPGFAGTYSDSSLAGGWGGRKSDGTNGWSARGAFAVTTSTQNSLPNRTPIATYLYHADMEGQYGDTLFWNKSNAAMLKNNTWYAVEQYIRLNAPGNNDGIYRAWVNGVLVFNKQDIRFTDNPQIGIESVWLNVYHGGKLAAPKDLTLYIDDIIVANQYIGSPLIEEGTK